MRSLVLLTTTVEHLYAATRLNQKLRRQYLLKASLSNHVSLQDSPVALIDRRGKYVEGRENLNIWRQWARNVAKSAVLEFHGAEKPSITCLYTEIDWLLEDNMSDLPVQRSGESPSLSKDSNYAPKYPDNLGSCEVLLRLSLVELKIIWQRRLLERIPLQYLTNFVYWRDLSIIVTPAVLIPRPETELLIDFALSAYEAFSSSIADGTANDLQRSPWLDLGTGSGALAIALAKDIPKYYVHTTEPPDVKIYAVDISPEACAIAEHNSTRLGFSQNIKVFRGSWFEPLDGLKFSGILSNPPYIPSEQLHCLQLEVRDHEPYLALNGGFGVGADSLLKICAGAEKHLLRGGFLALETNGAEQAEFIKKILYSMSCFENIQVRSDHSGVQRFVTATKCLR